MLLEIFSFFYSLGVGINRLIYGIGIKKPAEFPAFVISVGNISAGGAGKTSFAMKLAGMLKDRNPAIVMRGYKGKEKGPTGVSMGERAIEAFGDEPMMIKKHLPDVSVIVAKRRRDGVEFAVSKLGKDTIILDDASQNFSVKKDREIVLIDALNPRGKFMREEFSALRRADAVLISRANLAESEKLETLKRKISKYNGSTFETRLEISAICDIRTGEETPAEKIRKLKTSAFCGIGNPKSFRALLAENGIRPEKFLSFPDHYFYKKGDIEKLDPGFVWLTTEKDAVKLENIPESKKILIVKTEVKIDDEKIKNLFL